MKTRYLILALLLTLLPNQAAAIMLGLSTAELTLGSDAVVLGKVANAKAQWNEDQSLIITKATVTVEKVVLGRTLQKEVTVEYIGGEIGDVGLGVSDEVQLIPGERVLLFLQSGTSKLKKRVSAYSVVGHAQGKYRIDADGIAGKSGFTVLTRQDAERIDNNIPLQKLIDKIRSFR